jgi:hypothetical protein
MWTCNRNEVKQVQKTLQEVEYTLTQDYSVRQKEKQVVLKLN